VARRRGVSGVPAKGVTGIFKKFLPGLKKPKGLGAKPDVPGRAPSPTPTPPRTRPDLTPSPIQSRHPLPNPRDLRLERGPDGLVTSINGRPVREFVEDLARQRADIYRQMRSTDPEHFTRREVGPMTSVLFDRRTGEFFEGNNRMLGDQIPDNLHPTLQGRVDEIADAGRANPNGYQYTPDQSGPYPHPDTPGTHSEVASANQALWAREAQGLPTDESALGEMGVDNRRLFGGGAGGQAACCANCTSILGPIESFAGKNTTFGH